MPSLDWQERLSVGLGAGALLWVGHLIADAYEMAGLYDWAIICVLGSGLAIAVFWKHRTARWFWPAIALLVAAHLIVLLTWKWGAIEPGYGGAGSQFRGAAGADFAVSALLLYLARGFFDPDAVAKTRPAAIAKAITLGFALLAFAAPLGLTFLVTNARQSKLAAMRTVLVEDSTRGASVLMECLAPNGGRAGGWHDLSPPSHVKEHFDVAAEVRFRVIEQRTRRQVELATVDGRHPSPDEYELLARCLTPHAA